MDPTSASYYRAILFTDMYDQRPIPASLVQLHAFTAKRNHALGLGGVISKAVALMVALTWLSSTDEGRKFAQQNTQLGDLFGGELPEAEEEVQPQDELTWDNLPVESEVVVTLENKSQKTGQFILRRGNWVDVRVDGEVKHFRLSKVAIPVGV